MNTSKGRVQSAHEPRYQERPTAADSAVGTEVACPYCMVEVRTRLAEAEQLLSACYSPVRRIAEGGSRTREDLDLAAETFAALKRYLKPVAVPADSAPAVTGNCGLCGQPRADHAEVAPDGKPYCRMKSGNAGNIVKHAVSADVVQP